MATGPKCYVGCLLLYILVTRIDRTLKYHYYLISYFSANQSSYDPHDRFAGLVRPDVFQYLLSKPNIMWLNGINICWCQARLSKVWARSTAVFGFIWTPWNAMSIWLRPCTNCFQFYLPSHLLFIKELVTKAVEQQTLMRMSKNYLTIRLLARVFYEQIVNGAHTICS